MNEVRIRLSDEQKLELQQSVHQLMKNEIEQARIDAKMETRYLTKNLACHYLHISNNTMDRWIEKGLPRTVIQGVIRFDKVCLDRWMAEHLIQQ